jgi:hypothetical protein
MPNYRNSTNGTIAANGASVSLAYREFFNGGVGVQLAGTFSGTLQFEMSINGTDFVAVQSVNVNNGSTTTTSTAVGIFKFDAVGALVVRVRSTAWTSGTATVHLTAMAG